AGGAGRGGTATATATGANSRLNLQGASQIGANGAGGAGTTGAGGLGQGGAANLTATLNGNVAALDASVSANGTGGAGASGGAGTGGVTLVSARSAGTLSLTGTTVAQAQGTGGGASGSGVGGAGRGGQAELFTIGGTLTGAAAAVRAEGRGGNGGTGGAGTGGAGVLGSRGDDTVATQAGAATLTGTVTGSASGFGGNGAASGVGGAGAGGSFLVASGSSAGSGSLDAQTVNVGARGVGGAGGAGAESGTGGAGGIGRGGTVTIASQPRNGTMRLTGANLDAGATGGVGGASASGTGGRGGDATGGTAEVQVTNNATGTQTVTGSANIGTLAALSSATGGAGGAGAAAAQGGAGGAGTGGASRITLRGGSLTGGATQVLANGTGGASSAAGGIGSGGVAAISAAPRQGVTETQTLNLGAVTIAANGTGGAGATAGAARFGEALLEATTTSVTFASLAMNANGTAPRLSRPDNSNADVPAGPSVIRADRSNVVLGGTSIGVGGNLNFATAGSGSIRSNAAINANAAGTIAITHEGAAAAAATVAAPTISLTSSNINLAQGAILGGGTATTLNLNATPNGQQVTIGGDTEGPGYTLTQAEAARIEAGVVNFSAPAVSAQAGRPADVLVRNLTLEGSQTQGGGSSTVTLSTPGRVRVEGTVNFTNAAATDRLSITGTERVEVITPGGITMRDASNQLSGVLQLMSDNIIVTDSGLAGQLAADPNFTGRDAALRTNNGAATPAGFVQAGGVQLLSGGRIFVQNTGTATEFAGLTVGGGGLLVGRMTSTQNPGGGTGGGTGTTNFSFVGTLTTANEVLFFDFTVTSASDVTLRSYSYAGGTNAQGQVIAGGNFDPILALFNSAGVLIDDNDDGGTANVPTDPATGAAFDVFLRANLQPGSYKVAVSAFSNFAIGPNLSNGFENDGDFNGRGRNFAFDVLGANSASGPGQAPSQPTTAPTVIAFGRQVNADGSVVSGSRFFEQLGFNNAAANDAFAAGSSFNNLTIGQAVPASAPSPVSGAEVILGPITAAASAAASQDDGDGDGGPGGSFGSGFIGIVDAGQLANESLIEDPVASGGDSTLWTDGEDDDDDACDTPGGTRPDGTTCSAAGAPVGEP
ncbi:MAG TPA: DVUA0089 family protein, partial [Allosphingosinicella sp.]